MLEQDAQDTTVKSDDADKGIDALAALRERTTSYTAADRRAVLRMGMAGLPMMMTLRASAQENYVSILRCMFTIPCGYTAMISTDGEVWMVDNGWSSLPDDVYSAVVDIKENHEFYFPAGTAPQDYYPDNTDSATFCVCEGDGEGKGGKGSGDDELGGDQTGDDDDSAVCGGGSDDGDGKKGNKGKGKGDGKAGDDDSGDTGDTYPVECYKFVLFPCDQTFPAGDIMDVNANITGSGDEAFWVTLALAYTEQTSASDFPGVSCLLSILNYTGS